MDSAMSEDLEAVRDTVNRFMQTEVVPVMDGYEKRGEFPRDLIRRAGEAGLYGAVFPESLGGTNLGYLAAAVIQEEMARNDVRFAACNNQQGSTCPSCVYFGGTPEQIKKYVPKSPTRPTSACCLRRPTEMLERAVSRVSSLSPRSTQAGTRSRSTCLGFRTHFARTCSSSTTS